MDQSINALQGQVMALQNERDNLSQKLQLEIQQTEDRKKKMKEFLKQISSEKEAAESNATELRLQLTDAVNAKLAAEQQIQSYELKMGKAKAILIQLTEENSALKSQVPLLKHETSSAQPTEEDSKITLESLNAQIESLKKSDIESRASYMQLESQLASSSQEILSLRNDLSVAKEAAIAKESDFAALQRLQEVTEEKLQCAVGENQLLLQRISVTQQECEHLREAPAAPTAKGAEQEVLPLQQQLSIRECEIMSLNEKLQKLQLKSDSAIENSSELEKQISSLRLQQETVEDEKKREIGDLLREISSVLFEKQELSNRVTAAERSARRAKLEHESQLSSLLSQRDELKARMDILEQEKRGLAEAAIESHYSMEDETEAKLADALRDLDNMSKENQAFAGRLEAADSDVQRLRAEVLSLNVSLVSSRDALTILETSKSDLDATCADLQAQLKAKASQTEAALKETSELRNKLSASESAVADLKAQLTQTNISLAKEVDRCDGAQANCRRLEDSLNVVQSQLEALRTERDNLSDACRLLEQERSDVNISSTNLLDKIMVEKEALSTELKTAQAALESSKVDARALARRVDTAHEEQEKLREEITAWKTKYQQTQDRADTAEQSADAAASLRSQLNDATSTLQKKTEELLQLTRQLESRDGEALQLQSQVTAMSAQRDEAMAAKRAAEDLAALMRRAGEEKAAGDDIALRLSQSQAAVVQEALKTLQEQHATTRAELFSTQESNAQLTETLAILQGQLTALQIERDQLSQKLHSEILQNEDRKKKLRDFVNQLNSEKEALQQSEKELQLQLVGANSAKVAADQHIQLFEMKVTKIQEQALLEKDMAQREFDTALKSSHVEISRLQGLVDAYAQEASGQVLEIQGQLEAANKELESHKAKRLAARNEMIGMAQTLENALKEGQHLKAYVQLTLAPMVYDMILSLEFLLGSVELASAQLGAKKMIRLQTRALNFITPARFPGGNGSAVESGGVPGSTEKLIGHTAVNGGVGGSGKLRGNGMLTASGSDGHGSGGGWLLVTTLAESKEQAVHLKAELDKVQAGMALLTQSMGKLTELVRVDTRCCAGIFDVFFSQTEITMIADRPALSRPALPGTSISVRGGLQRKRQSVRNFSGYDRLDMEMEPEGGSVMSRDDMLTSLVPAGTSSSSSSSSDSGRQGAASASSASTHAHSLACKHGSGGEGGVGGGGLGILNILKDKSRAAKGASSDNNGNATTLHAVDFTIESLEDDDV